MLFDPADAELTAASDAFAARLQAEGEPIIQLDIDHRLTFQPR